MTPSLFARRLLIFTVPKQLLIVLALADDSSFPSLKKILRSLGLLPAKSAL